MPSHEDYLDSLLKGLEQDSAGTDSAEANGAAKDVSVIEDIKMDLEAIVQQKKDEVAASLPDLEESDAASVLEAQGSLSEEDIERILSASAEKKSEEADDDNSLQDIDLLSMLDRIEDIDLQDIQEVFDKADNNEAMDEKVLQEDLKDEGKVIGMPGNGEGEQEPLTEKERRAQEKKRRKEEKAQAKAEKAAAKAAAKEAKAAAKAAKAAAKTAAVAPLPDSGSEAVSAETKKRSDDRLFDTSLLDAIVAGADQAEDEEIPASENDIEETDMFANSDDDVDFADLDEEFDDTVNASLGESSDDTPAFAETETDKANAQITDKDEAKPEKKGLFSKILEFLTEEEEGEESGSLQLSDENREILDDLNKEKAEKKKKKKKEKKADGGEKAKAKKPKKPKPEKPKKEKLPEPVPLIPERKLTLKRVLPIALASLSFGVFIIIFANASVDFMDKQTARDAYYAGDYQTCFQNLYGKDLDESEQFMFGKSESILYIRLWLREYEMFVEEGSEIEALDSLIQTVDEYPKLYDYAVSWNADAEVAAGYQTILNILLEKYGLTEEQVREISAVNSDREYTRMVVEIVQREVFGYSIDPEPEPEQAPLQDVLPEEEDLIGSGFVGN